MRFLHENLRTRPQVLVLGFVATMAFLWRLSSVLSLKPIMLQDEWIYAYGSLRVGLWEKTEFDYGNPLFNVIFSSTSLCQDAYYTCGKLLNLGFSAGFAVVSALLAITLGVPRVMAVIAGIAVFVSPVGAYSSMFVPEPLYFLLLSVTFFFIAKSLKAGNSGIFPKEWIFAGIAFGLAALTKPHALLFLPALGVGLIVFAIGNRWGLRRFVLTGLWFGGSFLAVRLVAGLLLGGPKTLDILGSYGASSSLQRVFTESTGSLSEQGMELPAGYVGAGPVNGAFGLFWGEFDDHLSAIAALLGLVLILILVGAASNLSPKNVTTASQFSLFLLITVVAVVVSISLFEGWITGSGDDHNLRILMRYYDFLVPLMYVAGLAVLHSHFGKVKISNLYWLVGGAFGVTISILGVQQNHESLMIQIADAPFMAGLVTDSVLRGLLVIFLFVGVLAILLLRTPVMSWALSAIILIPLIWMGQGSNFQYQFARSELSSADRAGKFLASNFRGIPDEDLLIVATTRFDARTASFWSMTNSEIELVPPGTFVNTSQLQTSKWALLIGDVNLYGTQLQYGISGSGYSIFRLEDSPVTGFGSSTYNRALLASTKGLSGSQDWGSWLVGQLAVIETVVDLAEANKLRFRFLSAPGSAGELFTIRVGDISQDFQVPDSSGYFEVSLALDGLSSNTFKVEIVTPSARSGMELGLNADPNPLGIGLAEMALEN